MGKANLANIEKLSETVEKYKESDIGAVPEYGGRLAAQVYHMHPELQATRSAYGGKRHITAHAYVKKSGYTTKRELRWIDKESNAYRFSYRKGRYNRIMARTQREPSSG